MYQALYRKYRPKNFDDVVGQEQITTTLKHEVVEGKTSHAYLFTGSRGTGKTTCSKILAKAVNCLVPQDGNPCCECEICRGVEDGSVMDVTEIDAASNNGVDHIRQLREEAFFLPAQTKKRVYIIDETHMLSTGAFNALLKIMEEPPAHVLFILATTEVHKVPATILSRCQRFDFRRIAPDVIAKRLEEVAGREELALAHDAALLIARLADGGMRDALSLLDLCASHSREITCSIVGDAAGLAGSESLYALAEAIAGGDTGAALETLDALHTQSMDLERLCEELISHFRNLMILKSSQRPEELVVALPAELERMKAQAAQTRLATVLNALTVLQETLGRMGRSSNRRVELEMAVIRLCNPKLDASSEALLARLEKLEALAKGGGFQVAAALSPQAEEAKTAKPPKKSMQKQAPAPPQGAREQHMEQGGTRDATLLPLAEWSEVLALLGKTNPALCGTLRGSTAYVRGDICLIDCSDELFFTLIRQSEVSKKTLREAIAQQTGKLYRLGPYKREEQVQEREVDPLEALEQLVRDSGAPLEIK